MEVKDLKRSQDQTEKTGLGMKDVKFKNWFRLIVCRLQLLV